MRELGTGNWELGTGGGLALYPAQLLFFHPQREIDKKHTKNITQRRKKKVAFKFPYFVVPTYNDASRKKKRRWRNWPYAQRPTANSQRPTPNGHTTLTLHASPPFFFNLRYACSIRWFISCRYLVLCRDIVYRFYAVICRDTVYSTHAI